MCLFKPLYTTEIRHKTITEIEQKVTCAHTYHQGRYIFSILKLGHMLRNLIFTPQENRYVVVKKPNFLWDCKIQFIELKKPTQVRVVRYPLVNRVAYLFFGKAHLVYERT